VNNEKLLTLSTVIALSLRAKDFDVLKLSSSARKMELQAKDESFI
jgi:hypothetical protein